MGFSRQEYWSGVPRILPQLEKNHVVPTSWQDEALARHGVSRKVPCSALKGETVPESLPALATYAVTVNR